MSKCYICCIFIKISPLPDSWGTGFMYSADADGRGRMRMDADGCGHFYKIIYFIFVCVFAGIFVGTPPPPPHPRIMNLWRSIQSTTQIAQLRWRNVANVGMVAVGTTTVVQRYLANDGPTYFCQPYANDVDHVGKIRSENTCSLIFWRGICFPGVKYKINHKNAFELKCTMYHIYEDNIYINFLFVIFIFLISITLSQRCANVVPTI